MQRRLSALAAALLIAAPAVHATSFTSQAAFLAGVQSGYYLENFDGLPGYTFLGSPLSFSGTGFAYENSNPDGLYSTTPVGSDVALATNLSGQAITITITSGLVTAIGANVYGSDISGLYTPGSIVALLDNGETLTLAPADAGGFAGFITASPIVSLTIHPENFNSAYWPTLDNLIVGQAVTAIPEPATALLLVSGLLSAGFAARRRHGR